MFKKKENKGIKEVFESTRTKNKNLPSYKIPSHTINGLLTVIFGGSTGIEVSTVVATATIGSVAQQKENVFRQYKQNLFAQELLPESPLYFQVLLQEFYLLSKLFLEK